MAAALTVAALAAGCAPSAAVDFCGGGLDALAEAGFHTKRLRSLTRPEEEGQLRTSPLYAHRSAIAVAVCEPELGTFDAAAATLAAGDSPPAEPIGLVENTTEPGTFWLIIAGDATDPAEARPGVRVAGSTVDPGHVSPATRVRCSQHMTQLGRLIARGNTSDVFAWGRSAVVKILREGIPKSWAEREARTTALVNEAGLPAPAVGDVVVVGGRPGVVFERIDGPVMWDRIVAEPDEASGLCHLLAQLQAELLATVAPSGLPAVRTRLHHNIGAAAHLTDIERDAALADLAALPDGSALCHYDIHPANVLMGADGPVIIDWFDAGAGDPHADVVRSSILMRHHGADGHLGGAEATLVASLHDRYVGCVVAERDLDRASLLRWEPASLAGRLGEPLPAGELADTYAMWQAGAARSPLRAALAA